MLAGGLQTGEDLLGGKKNDTISRGLVHSLQTTLNVILAHFPVMHLVQEKINYL